MKKFFATLVLATAVLTGCNKETPVTWQIHDVYLPDAYPSELPETVAGAAVLTFGYSTLAGSDGCAQFNAKVAYEPAGANFTSAQKVTISQVNVAQSSACEGAAQFYHERIMGLIENQFEIKHDEQNQHEIVLLAPEENTIRPGFRLVVGGGVSSPS